MWPFLLQEIRRQHWSDCSLAVRRYWAAELDQVGQVVVKVVEQREWEAQGSVRISVMYLGKWSWCPGWSRENHESEF